MMLHADASGRLLGTMRAALYHGRRTCAYRAGAAAGPARLLRVRYNGICGSDCTSTTTG
jgi:hypothetical protein